MDPRPPALSRTLADAPAEPGDAGDFAVGFEMEPGPSSGPELAASPRIGVLHNPRSHRNRAAKAVTEAHPDGTMAAPGDPGELTDAITRFAADGIDVLVIDGGDGTVRDVLTHGARVFGSAWPRLAVLPNGKTNALAIDLGIPRDWSLNHALAAVRDGRVVRRRPIVVEGDGDPSRELWGFILGTGAFNAAIQTGQLAHRLGVFQGLAVGLSLMLGMAQVTLGIGRSPWCQLSPMRLFALPSGEELPHAALGDPEKRYLALFSTLRGFPLGIMPFRPDDRSIRYLLIDVPSRRMVARLPAILSGKEHPDHAAHGIRRGMGEEFRIDVEETGFILDGEAFAPRRMRLRQGPALEFIVPR